MELIVWLENGRYIKFYNVKKFSVARDYKAKFIYVDEMTGRLKAGRFFLDKAIGWAITHES